MALRFLRCLRKSPSRACKLTKYSIKRKRNIQEFISLVILQTVQKTLPLTKKALDRADMFTLFRFLRKSCHGPAASIVPLSKA